MRGITLFLFGGVSQLAHEAQRPWTEFLVAIVGPLTSLLLAALLGGLWYWSNGASSYLREVLSVLAVVNLSLGIFNLLPGFPLDGGRVLRAIVWCISGSYWRATQVASRAGQGLGLLMIGRGYPGLAMAGRFSRRLVRIGRRVFCSMSPLVATGRRRCGNP